MVYHHKISDTDQLKRVHIDCWAQLSQETLNRAIDQLLSVRHTARLSRTNRHKVIKSGKQSGFWPTFYIGNKKDHFSQPR